ncbi:hypothetical protein TRFO_04885 [Tritrichomonas foetus]|uniref:Leucine Rich Repeat family protein n=1 Tax=Tritrichomonas foetus TaxID=1144522 RepID=A0A1J4KBD7_9EUKA|nr:hypothetical protein TRFO_04885 [Tritrichomonas foetus]|eukprot:OHT08282.1 hypothetical protein TRFO_04885 [Tritrichomonas foetus]
MNQKRVEYIDKDIKELVLSDVPNDTEYLDVSFNKISSIKPDFFYFKVHLFSINLSYNQLETLDFLKCFRCIGYLDISNNLLEIDDLFDIRKSVIINLKLNNNNFDEIASKDKFLIPTIMEHAWIINGQFITDNERKLYSKYKETLEFGKSILAGRRHKILQAIHTSSAQAGKNYMYDHEIEQGYGVKFTPPLGTTALKIDVFPQIHKIQYLLTSFQFDLPKGEFNDYFGVALGILAHVWIGEQINLLSRYLSRAYYFKIQEDVLKMEHWKLILVLYMISLRITSYRKTEAKIWKTLNVDHFLNTGKIPLIGSTPRLVLSAFIARAIVETDEEPTESSSDDLRTYFKYRKICGFTQLDSSMDSVYTEMIAPLYHQSRITPVKNDKIEFTHPISGDWVKSIIKYVKNGRIFIRISDVIVQIPISSVFWDSRGLWREAIKKDSKYIANFLQKKQKDTFVTATDLYEADETAITQSFAPQPPSSARNGPSNRRSSARRFHKPEAPRRSINFQDSSQNIYVRETEYKSPFVQPIQYDESKLMPGWRTFRGIVDPPYPKSQRSNRIYGGLCPGQSVKDVINVVNGNEYSKGKRVKRYNVKLYNAISEKSKFVWITDDEISKSDAKRLDQIYQKRASRKVYNPSEM